MTTAQDIITDTLRKIRVYAANETPGSNASMLMLRELNRMMDSWSNETSACFATLTQSGVLVPGTARYNLGTGSTFNTQRPITISEGRGAAYITDDIGNNFPVDVVTQDAWNSIGNRTVTSDIPDTIWYDPQFPVGVMNVFPTPSIAYTLYWVARLQLQSFPSLQTEVQLPQGYEAALLNNLCLAAKPYFKEAQIDPLIVEAARETKAAIKRTNTRTVEAVYDPEIVARGSGTYNIYRDSGGGRP